MVIGGQAVLIYGEPRLTRDIDITLGIGVEELEKIVEIVKRLKLKILINDIDDFVRKTMVFPTLDTHSGIRIDFIFSFSLYEMQAIEKASTVMIGKIPVKFASLEDVVIHKIVAGRARDIEDIKSILIKNPDYNADYINQWLEEFDKSLGEDYRGIFKKVVEDLK